MDMTYAGPLRIELRAKAGGSLYVDGKKYQERQLVLDIEAGMAVRIAECGLDKVAIPMRDNKVARCDVKG